MHQSITTTLGLNITSFILYGLAFLFTVGILSKFVWPPLTRVLDAKADELNQASRLEAEAKAALAQAETEADQLLKRSKTEAESILETARTSASTIVSEAQEKARLEAERIAQEGRASLEHEVAQARVGLKKETARLVALATGNLLGEKISVSGNEKLITHSLERAESSV